ncbi:hypothetical protein Tco_0291972 [Tanacetum coccineum]
MVATAQNTNNTTIRSILLAEKLIGSNFTNWYEKKMKFLEQPIGLAPDPENADPDASDKYYKSVNTEQEVACLMLSSMSPDLQRTLEKYNAYDMMKELKTMFEEQAKQELFKTVKALHACKQEEAELHAIHEKCIPKKAETPTVLAIREGRIQKDKKKKPQGAKGKGKGKNKLARVRERISLLMIPMPRSHRYLRKSIRQRTLSATTVRSMVSELLVICSLDDARQYEVSGANRKRKSQSKAILSEVQSRTMEFLKCSETHIEQLG